MKSKYFLLVLGASMAAVVSCRQEKLADDVRDAAPIIRISEDIATDAVLVKFSSALSDEEQKAVESTGGVKLQRVFPSTPGKEALEKEFGLDRWYEAVLEEGDNVHSKVQGRAARDQPGRPSRR